MASSNRRRAGAAAFALAAIAGTPVSAFEFKPGQTYSCPNGVALFVKEAGPDRLVTIGPATGAETSWSKSREQDSSGYQEQGFLAFYSLVTRDGAEDFAFVTPDGVVEGCR